MEGDSVEQGEGQQPEVDTEEEIPYTAETLPLSSEVIQQHISLIARTASGTSHAFTRLEIHDAQITSVAEIKNYPHLRYIVSLQSASQLLDDKIQKRNLPIPPWIGLNYFRKHFLTLLLFYLGFV
jgi:hypothetical protein